MHRTTIIQNKILTIIVLAFFCPANIYRPSLGNLWLGRPYPKQFVVTWFISQKEIKKKHSTQNCICMH